MPKEVNDFNLTRSIDIAERLNAFAEETFPNVPTREVLVGVFLFAVISARTCALPVENQRALIGTLNAIALEGEKQAERSDPIITALLKRDFTTFLTELLKRGTTPPAKDLLKSVAEADREADAIIARATSDDPDSKSGA